MSVLYLKYFYSQHLWVILVNFLSYYLHCSKIITVLLRCFIISSSAVKLSLFCTCSYSQRLQYQFGSFSGDSLPNIQHIIEYISTGVHMTSVSCRIILCHLVQTYATCSVFKLERQNIIAIFAQPWNKLCMFHDSSLS